MFSLSIVNYSFILTPVEELGSKIVILFLSSCTPRSSESILCIACPATREILTNIAIAFALVACHCYLTTIIQLRNTTRRCQQCDNHLIVLYLRIYVIDTCCIVIFGKDKQVVDVFIQKIISEIVVELYHTFVPRRCRAKCFSYSIKKWKIHHSRQVSIIALYRTDRAIFLPIRHLGTLVEPHLPHNIEMRILIGDSLCPFSNAFFVVIRIGIYAQTVEVGVFYPPNCILGEVVKHQWICLVEVGHRACKPTFFAVFFIPF